MNADFPAIPADAPLADPSHEDLLEMTDQILVQMSDSVGDVSSKTDILVSAAGDLSASGDRLHHRVADTDRLFMDTNNAVDTVAAATEQLSMSAEDIFRQTSRALEQTEDALAQSSRSRETVRSMSDTAGRIGDVVAVVQQIAFQTRLLALNASVEAARAGEAGRGFTVVADEVKKLSEETDEAIASIRALAEEISAVTAQAETAIIGIDDRLGGIKETSSGITDAVEQQRLATEDISRSAVQAADNTRAVHAAMREVADEVAASDQICDRLGFVSKTLACDVGDLDRRLTISLRSSFAGDRRAVDRVPTALPARLRQSGSERAVISSDMSVAGMCLQLNDETGGISPGSCEILLGKLPPIKARIVAVSEVGVHVCFLSVPERTGAAIENRLIKVADTDQPFIDLTVAAGERMQQALNRALDAGRFSRDDLFDSDYQPIDGTDPQQYLTRFTALTDEIFRPVQEEALKAAPEAVFCVALDRNGYLPTHNDVYSQPQKPDDPVWNAANCRNRRIFDDRTGLVAARNRKPFIVQTYLRDMGGGRMMILKEVDVPLVAGGRHWGGLRLAYKL